MSCDILGEFHNIQRELRRYQGIFRDFMYSNLRLDYRLEVPTQDFDQGNTGETR